MELAWNLLPLQVEYNNAFKGVFMLRAAIIFFVLALVSVLLGAYGIAGLSLEIGKILLGVFLVLALISFVASLVSGKKQTLT